MMGISKILNRALGKVSMRFHVAKANLWRDSYNPLRGLTMSRGVNLLEEGERGAFAGLQWLYRYIEMQDATLGALIERRTSAVQKMDWDIKIPDGLKGADLALAERQAAVLRETYNGIDNLTAAIEHLCMASFRGFAHLEIVKEGGKITELDPVEQWYWVRNGLNGPWLYNGESRLGTTKGEDIDLRRFVIREVSRPINRVALVCFLRKSMSQKDWDGFIETFGIPAVFIIAPKDVPQDKEGEYQEVAEDIASDARGVLPSGSDVKTVDNGARGTNPFLEHIKYQDEQVILRGTGGKLTMLAESGSGTLAGSAHKDTFDEIAEAEAKEISEFLRKSVDRDVLDERFPGQVHHASFEIAANEVTDGNEVVKNVVELKKAGYHVKESQITEKTGLEFRVEEVPEEPEAEEVILPTLKNRHFSGPNAWRDFMKELSTQNKTWQKFPASMKGIGIPRAKMPQVKSSDRAAFVNFLGKRGIKVFPDTVKAKSLKPMQAEYLPEKVQRAIAYGNGVRRILITQDNYILDGHHQWLASRQLGEDVKVIIVMSSVMEAFGLAQSFPSTRLENRKPAESEIEEDTSDEETFREASLANVKEALAGDFEPILASLAEAMTEEDEAARDTKLKAVMETLEGLGVEMTAREFENLLASALVNGWDESKTETEETE